MIRHQQLYSECCHALPLGELDLCTTADTSMFLGRCSMCMEHAIFKTNAELLDDQRGTSNTHRKTTNEDDNGRL